MSAPPIRVFTREQPCTKVEIWNCFHDPRTRFGFMQVSITHARSIIGAHVPINLVKRGYAHVYEAGRVDMIVLTPTGQQWLLEGVQALVKRAPSKALKLIGFNTPSGTPRKRISRL